MAPRKKQNTNGYPEPKKNDAEQILNEIKQDLESLQLKINVALNNLSEKDTLENTEVQKPISMAQATRLLREYYAKRFSSGAEERKKKAIIKYLEGQDQNPYQIYGNLDDDTKLKYPEVQKKLKTTKPRKTTATAANILSSCENINRYLLPGNIVNDVNSVVQVVI